MVSGLDFRVRENHRCVTVMLLAETAPSCFGSTLPSAGLLSFACKASQRCSFSSCVTARPQWLSVQGVTARSSLLDCSFRGRENTVLPGNFRVREKLTRRSRRIGGGDWGVQSSTPQPCQAALITVRMFCLVL